MKIGIGSTIVLVFGLGASPAFSQTIRCVNSSNPACMVSYPTIQDAVDASIAGDIILVGPGTYSTLTTVHTTVSILGAQSGVSACDLSRPALNESVVNDSSGGFHITADNVALDGFTIQDVDATVPGSQGAGVVIEPTVTGIQIVNNILTNNTLGIRANGTGLATTLIQHNKFDGNNLPGGVQGGGIHSDLSLSNVNIDGNCFVNNTNASLILDGLGGGAVNTNVVIQGNVADNLFEVIAASGVMIVRNRIDHASGPGLLMDFVSNVDISCNTLTSGSNVGIGITNTFSGQTSSNVNVHLNNIEFNAGGLIISPLPAYATPPLDATNNWWGDASGPFNAAANPGGAGNEVSNNVAFAPFRATPTLFFSTCPSNVVRECAGPAGTTVTYQVTATSACDPAPTVICSPPSGSVFLLGGTDVSCTARDNSNATARCNFAITVTDTTPPTLTCPGNIDVDCSPSGSVVNFSPSVSDICDPAPITNCVPPSGSTFPFGMTTVMCTSTDASSNPSNCSFQVNVFDTGVPVISMQPISRTASEGSVVTFTVAASGGALAYQWRHEGMNIPEALLSSFFIGPLRAGDMGNYDVVVTNNCGSTTSNTVTLTVTPVTLHGAVALGDASDPNNPPGAPRHDPREIAISTAGGVPKAFIADFQHGGITVLDLSAVPATFQAFLPAPAGFTSAIAVSTKDDSVGVTYYDPDNGSQAVVYSATTLAIIASFRLSPVSSACLPSSIAIADNSVLVVADPVRQTVQGWFYSGPNAGTPTGPAIVTSDPAIRFGPGYAPTMVRAVSRGANRFAVVLERDSERIVVFPIRPNGALASPVRRFATGQLPEAVCVEPTSRFAFVSNAGNDTITVIGPDVPPGTVLITGVTSPAGISVSVDEFGVLHLYVASRGEKTIEHFCGALGATPTFFSALNVGRGSLSIASQPGLPVGNPPTPGDRIVVTSLVDDSVDDVGR